METPPRSGLYARWHNTPLYIRIVGGMILGVLVGLWLGPKAESLAIPSKLVLRILGALAPGLILIAIIQALITAKFPPGTAARLIRLLVLNTIVAILIGLFVANVVQPGRWSHLGKPPAGSIHEMAKGDMLTQFLENVPQSLFGPLTDNGKVMGVIFLAVAFGLGLRKVVQESPGPVVDLLAIGMKTLIVILHWVIEIVPLAVFGLVASIIGTSGFAAFHALGIFVLAVLLALLLQTCYYLIRIRLASWVSPFKMLKACQDALLMAFSTGSSTITMPLTYECLKDRVGLRERSASLGALVGSNFNNDGTALYEAMAALFISQLLASQGLMEPLALWQQVIVVVTSVIASVGAAGIPEAGLVTMTLVFSAVNLPPVYIALLLPVDWFLDRCRTVINVLGDINVSCMIDGQTRGDKELEAANLPAPVLETAPAALA